MAVYTAPRAEIDRFMQQEPGSRQEEMRSENEKWERWAKQHRPNIVDRGTMFGANRHVTPQGAEDRRNELIGYSIVRADSYDAATKVFEGHPVFEVQGGSVELMRLL